jgi:hypothetical protein
MPLSCLAYHSTLKMEATYYFEMNRSFGGICRLHLQGRIINETAGATCFIPFYYLAYHSTLNMEATYSFEINRRCGGINRLHLQGRRINQTELAVCFMQILILIYPSTLKMEATCYSETSADFQRTVRRYIPEYRSLQLLACYFLGFLFDTEYC